MYVAHVIKWSPRGQPTQIDRARVEHAGNTSATLNDDEADVQNFSQNGYEVAGLKQPVDSSDDDEVVAEIADHFVVQNMYTEVVGGDNDDSVHSL